MLIRYTGRDDIKSPWTEQRIRASLSFYLAEKTAWPTAIEFARDGFEPLHDAVTTGPGGIDRWAAVFGFDIPNRHRGTRPYWTDERLEAELRQFIGDKSVWPTNAEFLAAHQSGMLLAVREHGGVRLWAARLGIARRSPCSGRVIPLDDREANPGAA